MPDRRFFARSASDRTDDWPNWYIADRAKGELNVTREKAAEVGVGLPELALFVSRNTAERIDRSLNDGQA